MARNETYHVMLSDKKRFQILLELDEIRGMGLIYS